MGLSRARAKGRRESGPFAAIPFVLLESPEFAALSPKAVKLFIDLYTQYRGANNGDLTAAWRIMVRRGWKSRDTLERAKKELLGKGFIQITRQGGRNLPTLYAVTFREIDECGRKLDVRPTNKPSNAWKKQSLQLEQMPRSF